MEYFSTDVDDGLRPACIKQIGRWHRREQPLSWKGYTVQDDQRGIQGNVGMTVFVPK